MVEHSDIQGNILRGYTFPFARFVLLNFESADAGRTWLSSVVEEVTTGENWGANRPDSTFNIALTYPGLETIAVDATVLASFPAPFREGMASRSEHLGDVGSNGPASWEMQLGTPAGVGSVHALVSVYGESRAHIDAKLAAVLPEPSPGISSVHSQDAVLLAEGREHFGFRDGLSNPSIEDEAPPRNFGGGLWMRRGTTVRIPPGEFLTGYLGHDGIVHQAPSAPFEKNCTYLVFRKLHQDVARFRTYVHTEATNLHLDPEWVAARMVGRWRDGTPTVLSPDAPDATISSDPGRVNDFGYSQDPQGLACPLGAHIRRANPRDGLTGGVASVVGHRLIRRGITYGLPLPADAADDDQDRGLLFVACCVNLREQFEFVQRLWINDSGFTGTLDPSQKDAIVGNNEGAGTMTIPMPGFPRQLQGLPSFVRLRYGSYFIVPGIRAMRTLSQPH
jgi:Dyp-type peroxidase family